MLYPLLELHLLTGPNAAYYLWPLFAQGLDWVPFRLPAKAAWVVGPLEGQKGWMENYIHLGRAL